MNRSVSAGTPSSPAPPGHVDSKSGFAAREGCPANRDSIGAASRLTLLANEPSNPAKKFQDFSVCHKAFVPHGLHHGRESCSNRPLSAHKITYKSVLMSLGTEKRPRRRDSRRFRWQAVRKSVSGSSVVNAREVRYSPLADQLGHHSPGINGSRTATSHSETEIARLQPLTCAAHAQTGPLFGQVLDR